MRTALRLFAALCGSLLLAATLRHDVGAEPKLDFIADDPPAVAVPTQQTGTTPPGTKDPFTPYDVGGPDAIWPYESLTPDEQAVIDRGRDVTGWRQTHDAYATAVVERSKKARGEAAEHQLGIHNLELTGVVP